MVIAGSPQMTPPLADRRILAFIRVQDFIDHVGEIVDIRCGRQSFPRNWDKSI